MTSRAGQTDDQGDDLPERDSNAEIDLLTLTGEEREAIQWAVVTLDAEAALGDGEFEAQQAGTLRGLLARTQTGGK